MDRPFGRINNGTSVVKLEVPFPVALRVSSTFVREKGSTDKNSGRVVLSTRPELSLSEDLLAYFCFSMRTCLVLVSTSTFTSSARATNVRGTIVRLRRKNALLPMSTALPFNRALVLPIVN